MALRTLGPEHILEVIQAAIAPVVLISGVGLLLLTLSGRLGRIVDRTRIVAAERNGANGEHRAQLERQLGVLGHRARLVRLALALSASSVAVSGLLITLLFLGLLLEWNVTVACAVLFVAALLCLVLAMFVFVRELLHSLTALDLSIQESYRPPPG